MHNFINDASFKLNNHLKYYIMKKLFLTAAFTLAGMIAVSAQTEQNKPAETPAKSPPNTQTQQPDSKTNTTTPDTGTTQQNTTTTVETTPATETSKVTTMESTKPTDATKEEKKDKKKKK